MDLGRQWNERLKIWAQNLSHHYFTTVTTIEFESFYTMEHLTFEEAASHEFNLVKPGMAWGRMWEYGWFKTKVIIPDVLDQTLAAVTIGVGPEMLVYVNGSERGAIDKQHHFIRLSDRARAGECYEIICECYAGHGPRLENGGPYPNEVIPVVVPQGPQVTIEASYLGIWNEAFYQSAMDYLTLYSLFLSLPETSLRAMKIAKGLKEYTYLADFELEEPKRSESFVKARKVLQPLLACVNGTTAPEFTVFGQSHLDLAWLWPWEETKRKCARTYSNQLELMDTYKDYVFLLCEPPILDCLKEYYPALYERVKEKVKENRFLPEGGMYVESDTNLVSGESLIRQFIYGKQWFLKELGVDTKLAWLPDTFGFCAALPQIMKKCGITYFATQKLLRQDPECEPFPYNLFWWEGMDGSKILSHVYMKNNAVFEPKALNERWEKHRNQKEDIDGLMFPFGYGDGGGGPTRDMLEMYERCKDLEGAPRCHMQSPLRYFESYDPKQVTNTYTGELYLAWHRGTYTAQSETKKGLRKAEIAVHEAEFFICMLYICNQKKLYQLYVKESRKLWKQLLFLQFHDIVPGTSIERVHKEAVEGFTQIIEKATKLTHAMMQHLAVEKNEHAVTIYNSLGWERMVDGITVPACGFVTIDKKECIETQTDHSNDAVCVQEVIDGKVQYRMSNQYLSAVIDATGQVTSVKLRNSDREFIDGIGNEFCMFKDVNVAYDAWELSSMYEQMPVALTDQADIVIDDSPYPSAITPKAKGNQAVLLVERKINHSVLKQRICLERDSHYLKFDTTIEWNERHKLLKVKFPVNIHCQEAIEEIQFGCIKRPVTRSTQSEKDKYEVCNHKYTTVCDGNAGAAVLNDCKYGVSVEGSSIALSLLRAPVIPDMRADAGVHQFQYAFYPYEESFQSGCVVKQAYEFNTSLQFSDMPLQFSDMGGQESIAFVDASNVVIETVKPAEHQDGIVLRIYEALGASVTTKLYLNPVILRAYSSDMLELDKEELLISNHMIELEFHPFEIKTIILEDSLCIR